MLRAFSVVSMTVLWMLAPAAEPAQALDPPSSSRDAECEEQLVGMYDALREELHGVERQRDPLFGRLTPGQRDKVRLELQGGSQYYFGGACDTFCDNLDLVLRADDGSVVADDTTPDDVPVIEYIPDEDGMYTLEVTLPGCSDAPCNYRVGSFFQENPWLSQCHQQIDATAATLREEYPEIRRQGDIIPGSLAEGKSSVESLTLGPGEYLVLGVCDADCSDLNLVAKDADGKILDRDLEDDDYPVVAMEVTGRTEVQLVVEMAACGISPCFYGLGVFSF